MLLNELMGCGKTVQQGAQAWGCFIANNQLVTLGKSFNSFET